jgi:hypothetical protein
MKIEISFQLELDEARLRAKLLEDIAYGDGISLISKVLLKQLDLIVKGDFDGAYDLIVDWDTHHRSYMDPTVNEIINRIRHNRERTAHIPYSIKLA